MILEIIATSVEDVIVAQAFGANRIELLSGIREGGITPSYGLIEQAVRVASIPIHVMVRPHANSFCYNEDDVKVMVSDIRHIRESGAAGVVFGALTADKKVDVGLLEVLLRETGQLNVTFHRAFDVLDDRHEGLRLLVQYPEIRSILTSGGKPNVNDACEEISQLVKQSRDFSLQILAGSGLTVATLHDFIERTAVQEVHLGTGVRCNGQALEPIDLNGYGRQRLLYSDAEAIGSRFACASAKLKQRIDIAKAVPQSGGDSS